MGPVTGQPIYLVGGDEFSAATAQADERVLGMLGRKRVAVVPTAAAGQRPELAGENGVRHFAALGADARIVMILDKADAGDRDLCERLTESDLIYLTGGNPTHLVEVLQGSPALAALRQSSAQGAIVGGSSAGAMALGPVVAFPRQGVAKGLAMVEVVTVPHSESIEEERLQELSRTVAGDHTIVAIPSRSACLVTGQRLKGLGPDAVSVFAGGAWRRIEPGRELSLPD
jgi:peptidase E